MPFDLPPHKLWLPPKPAIVRAISREQLVLASFLPGMFPAGAAAGGGVLTTIVQQASATDSDGATITAPADIIAGDLLVLFDFASGFSVPTAVIPSGFTSIVDHDDGSFDRWICSAKIADGSEASATLTGMNSLAEGKVLVTFRGNIPMTAFQIGDADEGSLTSGNPAAQTVTSGSGTPPLIVFGSYYADGTVNPRTFTVAGSPAKDGEVNETTGSNMWLAWKIYNAGDTPADVVIDMDDEGDFNLIQSFYLELS